MARNRYGWQKRAKELARKEKNDEKMKRRQGKAISPAMQTFSEGMSEPNLDYANPVGLGLQTDS